MNNWLIKLIISLLVVLLLGSIGLFFQKVYELRNVVKEVEDNLEDTQEDINKNNTQLDDDNQYAYEPDYYPVFYTSGWGAPTYHDHEHNYNVSWKDKSPPPSPKKEKKEENGKKNKKKKKWKKILKKKKVVKKKKNKKINPPPIKP